MSNPSLHELNQHLYARLLPDTHAVPEAKTTGGKKGGKKGEPKDTPAPDALPELNDEQLAILKAAGIEDVAAADLATVKTILGL